MSEIKKPVRPITAIQRQLMTKIALEEGYTEEEIERLLKLGDMIFGGLL